MPNSIPPQFQIPFRPTAAAGAVVSGPNVRFSVLTSRLIRMEYSPSGEFEDHPSQAFWYREQPVPAFTVERSPERIEIRTEHLQLSLSDARPGRLQPARRCRWRSSPPGPVWHYGVAAQPRQPAGHGPHPGWGRRPQSASTRA